MVVPKRGNMVDGIEYVIVSGKTVMMVSVVIQYGNSPFDLDFKRCKTEPTFINIQLLSVSAQN